MVIILRMYLIFAFGTAVLPSTGDGANVTEKTPFGKSKVISKIFKIIREIENSEAVKNNVTKTCRLDVDQYIRGLITNQTWALRMFDATGKQGSDQLHLPVRMLGSKDGCEAITATDRLTKEVYFQAKYCRIDAPLPTPTTDSILSTAMMGMCVPETCTESDMSVLAMEVIEHTLGHIPLEDDMKVLCFEKKSFKTDFVFVACLIGIIISISVLGTIYDLVYFRLRLCRTGLFLKSDDVLKSFRNLFVSTGTIPYDNSDNFSSKTNGENVTYVNGENVVINHSGKMSDDGKTGSKPSNDKANHGTMQLVDISGKDTLYLIDNEVVCNENTRTDNGCTDDNGKDMHGNGHGGDTSVNSGKQKHDNTQSDLVHEANIDYEIGGSTLRSYINDVLTSFSLLTNIPKVLSLKEGEGNIEPIHGIRVLSMAWIVLGHSLILAYGYTANPLQYHADSRQHWTFMALEKSITATDTLFIISGMLLAYQTLKGLDKGMGDKKLNLLYFYLHKLWRLTPTYMLVLAIGTAILPYFLTSSLTNGTMESMESCKTNWWKHLFYINNYAEHPETSCMDWTWYMACTMQFFLISPFLLILLHKYCVVGLIVCGVMVLVTVMLRAIINNHFKFGITLLSLTESGLLGKYEYYMIHPAHTRLSSFVMGILVGYIVWKWKRDFNCPKIFVILGWIISLVFTSVVVYGCHYYDKTGNIPPQVVADVFNSLNTIVWSLAICWILFACATNNGGWINTWLSWKLFIPLSRLTYCVFLIHPLVILLYYENKQKLIHLSHYELVYMFLGNLVLSYVAAFIVSLLFELPFRTLEKRFFRR